jgi:hypothetical protein
MPVPDAAGVVVGVASVLMAKFASGEAFAVFVVGALMEHVFSRVVSI